jgi:hypothetical protein
MQNTFTIFTLIHSYIITSPLPHYNLPPTTLGKDLFYFIPSWSNKIQGIDSIFLLYSLKCDLFWIKLHVLLCRICIIQLLDGIFYSLLSPFDTLWSLVLKFVEFLCWSIYWWVWGIDVIHYFCTWTYVSMSSSVCFIKVGAPTFSAYIFISTLSYCYF